MKELKVQLFSYNKRGELISGFHIINDVQFMDATELYAEILKAFISFVSARKNIEDEIVCKYMFVHEDKNGIEYIDWKDYSIYYPTSFKVLSEVLKLENGQIKKIYGE